MKGFIAMCCAIGMVALANVGLQAEAEQVQSIGYAVRAILPDNQQDDKVSYFDLKVKPGQSQVLRVVIMNREDKEIEVLIEANAAFSNENGVIEFTPKDPKDPSLAVDFGKIVTPVNPEAIVPVQVHPTATPDAEGADERVSGVVLKVPAKGETIAAFAMEVPKEPFDGVVLGGLMFTKLGQDEVETEGSVAINNVYRYVIGVRLQEDEMPVDPAFELVGTEIVQSDPPSLLLHLRNPRPLIARDMSLHVSAYPSEGGEAVMALDRSGIAMAPNSAMAYAIRLDADSLLGAGTYRILVTLEYKGLSWQYETGIAMP